MEDAPDLPPNEAAFEFPLDGVPDREPLHADAPTEFFRQQLLNLLDVLVLTEDGRPVRVDGFAYLREPATVYRLWPPPQPADG